MKLLTYYYYSNLTIKRRKIRMTPLSKKVWPSSKMFGTHSTLLSYLPFDLKIILYFINLWASVLRATKDNTQTKNAWSKLVSNYSMHISTSYPKKVSWVQWFELQANRTGETGEWRFRVSNSGILRFCS